MKIEKKLIDTVFASKKRNALRRLFKIDDNENIKFVWIPLFNEKIEKTGSFFGIRKILSPKKNLEGIVATDKAIYFPLNSSVLKGNGNKYPLSDIDEISFDYTHLIVSKKRNINPTRIQYSYFCYGSDFISDKEVMAFIIGSLNMLLKNNQ